MRPSLSPSFALLVGAVLVETASASAMRMSYGGRLVTDGGAPVKGPVSLEVRFYGSATGGPPLSSALEFDDVALRDGVFNIELELTPAEWHAIFGDPTSEVWIEVKNRQADETYPRQRFSTVPFALKVPIDTNTLTYGADGKLTLSAPPQDGLFLSASGGELEWRALSGGGNADTLGGHLPEYFLDPNNVSTSPSHRFVTDAQISNWNTAFGWGDHSTAGYLTSSSILNADNITTGSLDPARIAQDASNRLVTDTQISNWDTAFGWGDHAAAGYITSVPWATPGAIGATTPAAGTFTDLEATNLTAAGELRLQDADASATVTIKANDTTAGSYTLKLPTTAPSANGQLLSVNTNGELSWATPGGGGDMMASTYDANTNGKVDVAEDAEMLGGVAASSYLTSSSTLNADNITTGALDPARIAQDASNRFVSDTQISNWNTAFGWGDHSTAGYLTSSSSLNADNITTGSLDPARIAQDASNRLVTDTQISNWNTAFGWGDHAAAGYITSVPVDSVNGKTGAVTLDADDIAESASRVWLSPTDKQKIDDAYGWGDHAAVGYLTSTSDLNASNINSGSLSPAYIAQDSSNRLVSDSQIADWDTAYSDRLKWDGGDSGLDASAGRASLGLGSLALQDADAVDITGGTISSVTLDSIDFEDDSISGDAIHGGTISDFASTGIDDNASATAVTIDSIGNVGIGEPTPSAKLHVGGVAGTDGIKYPDGTLQTTALNSSTFSMIQASVAPTITGSYVTSAVTSCPAGKTLIYWGIDRHMAGHTFHYHYCECLQAGNGIFARVLGQANPNYTCSCRGLCARLQ